MPIKEKLEEHPSVRTSWGKLIPKDEAYRYALRSVAAFSANLFQVMRILEPDFDKRTSAICDISYMMNTSVSGEEYMNEFYDQWNIPEFCERSAWLGAIFGDYGDEYENMAGRVIQFTRDRVEKELDACPWDIVGAEMCNMTTAMFTANFDLASKKQLENEVCLNMCEARGCGDRHCRVVAERRDKTGLPKQGWMDHMQQPVYPVHDTPRERGFRDAQGLRNGQYSQTFGEETSFDEEYHWDMMMCWVWSVSFPMIAIRDMAKDEDEFDRIFRIVFSTAGKNAYIDPWNREGLRSYLGVPHEIDENDPRIMGSLIQFQLDTQLVPNHLTAWTKDEVRIACTYDDFTGRYEMAPMDELYYGYESYWHNAVKTLVSPEWSVWFENVDSDDMEIVIGRKIDKKMV